MSFIDLCRQFIAIDTSPQAGTLEAGKWICSLAREHGFHVDLQEEHFQGQDQANVFIRTNTIKKEEFLLQSHFDTVNPGSHSMWTENLFNPFHGIIKEGKIFGLGACEAKLDLLCKIEALKSFPLTTSWKINPVVAGTFGEEIGMQGMLRALRRNKFSAKHALVGEPSGHQLIYAGQGFAKLEVNIPFSIEERQYRLQHNLLESVSTQSKIFKGKATHSTEGNSSDNAIYKSLEYLFQLPEGVVLMEIEGGTNHNTVANNVFLELDLFGGVPDPMVKKLRHLYLLFQEISSDFLITVDRDFTPCNPTFNLGLVQSTEDDVQLTIACRFPPVVTEDQYRHWLEKIQKGASQVGGEVRVVDYKRPYKTDLESPFVKDCLQVLIDCGFDKPACISTPTCTEMSLLERRGIQCLGFGAGMRKESTSFTNQTVLIKDLERSIEFYKAIIKKVCL